MRITKNSLVALFCCASICSSPALAQNNNDGYYKDIFMDSGIRLNSLTDLPVSRYLGLSIESFVSATHSPDLLAARCGHVTYF